MAFWHLIRSKQDIIEPKIPEVVNTSVLIEEFGRYKFTEYLKNHGIIEILTTSATYMLVSQYASLLGIGVDAAKKRINKMESNQVISTKTYKRNKVIFPTSMAFKYTQTFIERVNRKNVYGNEVAILISIMKIEMFLHHTKKLKLDQKYIFLCNIRNFKNIKGILNSFYPEVLSESSTNKIKMSIFQKLVTNHSENKVKNELNRLKGHLIEHFKRQYPYKKYALNPRDFENETKVEHLSTVAGFNQWPEQYKRDLYVAFHAEIIEKLESRHCYFYNMVGNNNEPIFGFSIFYLPLTSEHTLNLIMSYIEKLMSIREHVKVKIYIYAKNDSEKVEALRTWERVIEKRTKKKKPGNTDDYRYVTPKYQYSTDYISTKCINFISLNIGRYFSGFETESFESFSKEHYLEQVKILRKGFSSNDET